MALVSKMLSKWRSLKRGLHVATKRFFSFSFFKKEVTYSVQVKEIDLRIEATVGQVVCKVSSRDTSFAL